MEPNNALAEKYLDIVMQSNFPIEHYDKEYLFKVFDKLKNMNTAKLSNTGSEIVRNYHPSIWRCNIKDHPAPVDAWNDPEIMYKVICNRLKYLSREDLSLYNIRSGLTISKIAPKVSIFRPALAKHLIKKYLEDYATVFDPCAGFSGRLLGATALNKYYIGADINSITVKESNELIKDLKLNAKVYLDDSIYSIGTYDCLFTCPPYGDKEIWHQDIEVLSTDEWLETCIKNFDCKKYLFVIDKTEKYNDYIVETIKNTSHFGTNSEKVVLITEEDKAILKY